MGQPWWRIVVAALSSGATACSALSGLDDFQLGAGGAGAGAAGGAGGEPAGSGGAATSSGPGGGGGAAPGCPEATWAKPFPETQGLDRRLGVAIDAEASVITATGMSNSGFVGDEPVQALGNMDVLVAKHDAAGATRWIRTFGATTNNPTNFATGAAIDPAGHVLVAGSFMDVLDLDGTLLADDGNPAAFVAKLGGDDGVAAWAASILRAEAPCLAVTPAGGVVVGGFLTGQGKINGVTLPFVGGDDVFVIQLDPNGALVWQWTAGSPNGQRVNAVAAAPDGAIYAAGQFNDTFAPADSHDPNGTDAFVVKLDSGGSPLWSLQISGASAQIATAVGVDPDGAAIVAGTSQGIVEIGGQQFGVDNLSEDVFVAKLDADGSPVWVKTFGDSQEQRVRALAVDAAGRTWLTGHFRGTLVFDQQITAENKEYVWLAVLDADGNPVASAAYGNPQGNSRGDDVALDACGHAVIGGTHERDVDFGDAGQVADTNNVAAFLARLRLNLP